MRTTSRAVTGKSQFTSSRCGTKATRPATRAMSRAAERDPAAAQRKDAGDRLQQRALAAAVRTDEADDVAGLALEAHVREPEGRAVADLDASSASGPGALSLDAHFSALFQGLRDLRGRSRGAYRARSPLRSPARRASRRRGRRRSSRRCPSRSAVGDLGVDRALREDGLHSFAADGVLELGELPSAEARPASRRWG